MADERKDLPPVNSANFLEKVREFASTALGKRGDPLDRVVTLRDLVDVDLVKLRPGYGVGKPAPIAGVGPAVGAGSGGTVEPDLTPPPMPSGLIATAGFANLLIEHASPVYTQGHGHARTRVYGATYTSALPVFSDARLITEFTGTVTAHPTSLGVKWRIWVSWVSNDGVEGPVAGGTNGADAQVGLVGGADLAPLIIDAGKLAAGAVDLGSTKVTGTITDPARFGAAAIGYTVTQYLVATSGVLGNLVVDNAQIASVSAAKLLAGALSVGQYIRSTSYVAGSSGWAINADGTAEFSAASIRGQLSAAQINGTGLTIRRASDNAVILDASGSGTIDNSWINPAAGWLNSNIPTGRNLIPNSDQIAMTATAAINFSANMTIALSFASNYWADTYTLLGGSTRNLTALQTGVAGGGDSAPVYDIYPTGGWSPAGAIPVVPGQRYCFSVYMQAHRCYVGAAMQFFDASNNPIGGLIETGPVVTTESRADSLAQYARPTVFGVAPAGATTVRVAGRKYNTFAGRGDSYVWFAAPQLETVGSTATTPGAYSAGPPTSTRQLGYTGDLNATYGATIGANLGGSFTQATWDVVMSSAYIRLAHINTATIVNLSALSSVLGTVDIVAGGYLRSGQTAWSTGSGFWLGWIGSGPGEPGFSIGDGSAYLRYRPSTGLEIKLSTYTLSLSSSSGMAVYLYLGGNGTYTLGTYTATPAGGVAPYSYAWSVSTYSNGVNPAQFTALIQPSGNTCVMRVNSTASSSASVAQWVSLTCTVTDANGRATSTTYSPIISWNGYDTSGL